jgi:hypothetical protein
VAAHDDQRGAGVGQILGRGSAVILEEAREVLLRRDVLAGPHAGDPEVHQDARVREEPVRLEEGVTRRGEVLLVRLAHATEERRARLVARVGRARGRRCEPECQAGREGGRACADVGRETVHEPNQ